jgi:hypothetical protein
MLTAYGAETTHLQTRLVDPDRQPAEFLALQQKYGILAGKAEDGRVLTDASVVVARGERHWFITADELVAYDTHEGRARPRLEQAFTAALRNVLERDQARVCFCTGHQELSIDSGGPSGLGELRLRLEKDNYQVESVALLGTQRAASLAGCRVVVIAGPERTFSEQAAQRVRGYLESGGNVLILADPILGDDERILPTGLGPVAALGGIVFGNDFILERDAQLRLATGMGESHFVTPQDHAVTRGLVQGGAAQFRPIVTVAQSLRAADGRSPVSLLKTSEQAFSVREVASLTSRGGARGPRQGDARGPFSVAMAAQLDQPPGSSSQHGPRLVVVGTSNLAWGRNWRDQAALGSRLFVESALSWLAARPAIVSIPVKPAHDVGVSLTEESLSEVLRYVLIYMPGSTAAVGLLVVYRRRSRERKSRRRPAGPNDDARGAGPDAGKREQQTGPADDAPAASRDDGKPSQQPQESD